MGKTRGAESLGVLLAVALTVPAQVHAQYPPAHSPGGWASQSQASAPYSAAARPVQRAAYSAQPAGPANLVRPGSMLPPTPADMNVRPAAPTHQPALEPRSNLGTSDPGTTMGSAPTAMNRGLSMDEYRSYEVPRTWNASSHDTSWGWVQAEALLWWTKASPTPPLVTTSPQATLGVLGQPGTRVLYGGDIDEGTQLGGRFRLGGWLDECQTCGAEVSFFALNPGSSEFIGQSAGNPLLARPFVNALTGTQDAQQVANLAGPALPVVGSVAVRSNNQFWGFEGNLIAELEYDNRRSIHFLYGFRQLRLDEGLIIREDLLIPANSPQLAGTGFQVVDEFGTRNRFYGGQVGLRTEWFRRRGWSVNLLTKVAVGVTHETGVIKGATVIAEPGQVPQGFGGGLLAQSTNSGTHTRTVFAVVPEVGANVSVQLTPCLKATAGYNLLWWSNVARPGELIDVVVNPNLLPPGTRRGPARPAFQFRDGDFWAHGLNLGFEFNF